MEQKNYNIAHGRAISVSFSGCGFLGIYHVGVATAIREYSPHLLVNKICGASAGAIAASALICGCCLGQATTDFLKAVIEARARALGPLHPSFNIVKILRDGLRNNLPPDAHKRASGRLHISLTRFSDGKNILVTQFDSKEDLIQALICSAFIPFYCGTVPPMYKGVRYIDGGWSDNLPVLDAHTITVSPFSGESDICPTDTDSASMLSFMLMGTNVRFTARNLYRFAVALFPPHPEVLSSMCRQGFEDGLRFLAKHNLISCTRCVAVRSSISLPSGADQAVRFGFDGGPDEALTSGDELSADEAELDAVAAEAAHELRCGDYHGETRERQPQSRKTSGVMVRTRGTEVDEHAVEHGEDDPCSSAVSRRRRCETCTALETEAPKRGLPQVVTKRLRDAENLDKTIVGYFMSLRGVRLIRYMTIPLFLPYDLTVAAANKFLELLPTLPEDSLWLADRATRGMRFFITQLLNQVELQGEKYARIPIPMTCHLAVTEMNFTNFPTSALSPERSRIASVSSDDGRSRANMPDVVPVRTAQRHRRSRHHSLERLEGKRVEARRKTISSKRPRAGRQEKMGGQCEVTEMKFNFAFDADARSGPVNELRRMIQHDRPGAMDTTVRADDVARMTEEVGWNGLMRVVESSIAGDVSPPIVQDSLHRQMSMRSLDAYSVRSAPAEERPPQADLASSVTSLTSAINDDVDTIASVLEFVRRSESLMSFYYMDGGRMKVTEIHRVEQGSGANGEQETAGDGGARRRSRRSAKPLEEILSVDESELPISIAVPGDDAGAEEVLAMPQAAPEVDAPAASPTTSRRSSGSARRVKEAANLMRRGSATERQKRKVTAQVQPEEEKGLTSPESNSGSDAELFIPRRNRARRNSGDEREYDAELSSS